MLHSGMTHSLSDQFLDVTHPQIFPTRPGFVWGFRAVWVLLTGNYYIAEHNRVLLWL